MRIATVSLLAPLLFGVAPAAEPAPPPRPAFTLDQLNPADIPAEERFDGQPQELVAVLGSSRVRHAGNVTCAVVSPDGKLVASGGDDNLIRLWDARTLRPVAVLRGHAEPPYRLAFSPDGKWLASDGFWSHSSSRDMLVRVWAIDGPRSRLAATGRPHGECVCDFRFVPNGRELLTVTSKGEVRSWDLTADPPAEQFRFRIDRGEPPPEYWSVYPAEFTPEGRTLVAQTRRERDRVGRHRVELWDVATGTRQPSPRWERSGRVQGYGEDPSRGGRTVNGEEFSHRLLPDGKTLAFGLVARGEGRQVPVRYFPDGQVPTADQIDEPRRVVLWDLTGPEPKQVGTIPEEQVSPVKAAGGRRYVSWSVAPHYAAPASLHIWTVEGGRSVPAGKLSWAVPHYGDLGPQSLSPDGAVLVASTRNRVRVWDLTDGGPVERAPDAEPMWEATAVAFGPDGRSVTATGNDLARGGHHFMVRRDLADGPPRAVTTPLPVSSHDLVLSRDGRRVLSTSRGPSGGLVFDAATRRPVFDPPTRQPDRPTALTIDLHGDLLAGLLRQLTEPLLPVRERPPGQASFWSGSGEPRYALNEDGTFLAWAGLFTRGDARQLRVRVWDVRGIAPELTARLDAGGGGVALTAVVLSPDGRRLATGTCARPEPPEAGGEVAVWAGGRAGPAAIARFPAGKAGATALAFTADCQGLAAALPGENGACRVRVWDLAPEPRERWQVEVTGGVGALRFTPGGRLVGLTSGGLCVWDAGGKRVATWPDLGARAFAVAPDGRHIATANANGTVYVFRLAPG